MNYWYKTQKHKFVFTLSYLNKEYKSSLFPSFNKQQQKYILIRVETPGSILILYNYNYNYDCYKKIAILKFAQLLLINIDKYLLGRQKNWFRFPNPKKVQGYILCKIL